MNTHDECQRQLLFLRLSINLVAQWTYEFSPELDCIAGFMYRYIVLETILPKFLISTGKKGTTARVAARDSQKREESLLFARRGAGLVPLAGDGRSAAKCNVSGALEASGQWPVATGQWPGWHPSGGR